VITIKKDVHANIEETILKPIKKLAIDLDLTVTQIIEKALKEYLERNQKN
jgi:hypothetical protein